MDAVPTLPGKQRVYWPGLLMLAPALILGWVGVRALRQDKIILQHQAADEARKTAAFLAMEVLPSIFRLPSIQTGNTEDPLSFLVRGGGPLLACQIDAKGSMVYPLEASPWNTGPDITNLLSSAQLAEWDLAQKSVNRMENPGLGIERLKRLLEMRPPAEAAAIGLYQVGVLEQRLQQFKQAAETFNKVLVEYPYAMNESGTPLAVGVAFNLITLVRKTGAPTEQQHQWLDAACRSTTQMHPDLSAHFFQNALTAAGNEPTAIQIVEHHQAVSEAHAGSRAFYERLIRASSSTIYAGNGLSAFWTTSNELAVVQTEGTTRWAFGFARSELNQRMERVMQKHSLPGHLGLSVSFAGDKLKPSPGREVLATFPSVEANTAPFGLNVALFLDRPDILYRAQRERTLWFGSLVAASFLALLIGCVAAWWFHQRELRLNQMQSNFVSSVSHEMRAPLASVQLMAQELVEAPLEDPAKRKEYHRFILSESRRLAHLVENALDFARQDQGRQQFEFVRTDLAELVEDTAALMRPCAVEKRIRIELKIEARPEINADERALRQVFINLLDNAVKHSAPGDSVAFGLKIVSGEAEVFVRDVGPGIPANEQTKIFEKFYRVGSELCRETQGVGLGLAIVKFVTEAHRGKVTVESEPGHGATFTVALPLSQPRVRSTQEKPESSLRA